jgi:hypothetical protein
MYWLERERLLTIVIKARTKAFIYARNPKSIKAERRLKRGADPRGKQKELVETYV